MGCVSLTNSLVIMRTASNSLPIWGEVRSEEGFPGRTVVKNPPANAGDVRDVGLILGLGRSPGVGNGTPVQYSCLENRIDRGAWRTTVHGAAKSQTWLSMRLCAHAHAHTRAHTHTEEWRLSGRCTCQILNDNEKEKVRVIFFLGWTGNRIVTKFQFLHCANPILNNRGLCQIVLDLGPIFDLRATL